MKHACIRERLFSTVLVCLLIVTIGVHGSLVSSAYSAELTVPEKTMSFLTDVVRLDMTKYNVTLLGVVGIPPGENREMNAWDYTLTSDESKLDVTCMFKDNALVWCKLYPLEGSPLFTQPFTNVLDEAKSLLNRYQTYSGVSHIQPMRDMLDTVIGLTPMTEAVGDVRLEIRIDEVRKSIRWMNAVNGITNTYNVVTLRFRNGAFEFFCDFWNRYPIGNAVVNISKEEAIHIAREEAQNRIRAAVGDETASSFTFVSEYAYLTMQPREKALYPHWEVLLELNKMVLGRGHAFRVSVWADTGEVPYITYSGGYGSAPQSEEPPITTPTEPPTEPPPEDSTDQTGLDPTLLLIAVPVVLAIILGIAFYRRRKSSIRQTPLPNNSSARRELGEPQA